MRSRTKPQRRTARTRTGRTDRTDLVIEKHRAKKARIHARHSLSLLAARRRIWARLQPTITDDERWAREVLQEQVRRWVARGWSLSRIAARLGLTETALFVLSGDALVVTHASYTQPRLVRTITTSTTITTTITTTSTR